MSKVGNVTGRIQNAAGNFSDKPRLSKLQAEVQLHNARLLNRVSIELNEDAGTVEAYKKIVEAAKVIMGSQFATMQILHPEPGSSGKLHMVASNGFSHDAEKYWEWVYHYSDSSCAEALRTRRRVLVPDYRTCAFMLDAPTLPIFLEGGILAAQSTPLYSKAGKLLGMISTHWSSPHMPPQYRLDQMDILARHAADFIERTQVIDALREGTC